jgi:hypothetical protein
MMPASSRWRLSTVRSHRGWMKGCADSGQRRNPILWMGRSAGSERRDPHVAEYDTQGTGGVGMARGESSSSGGLILEAERRGPKRRSEADPGLVEPLGTTGRTADPR